MSQENNFIPNQENYKPLTPFQLFVKSNFPFIENTFEALDNYGLYCKIVEYLNDVINNENTVESNVQELYDAFVSLNTYVSDYFDNLDVQEEINNKLDEMATSGELQNLVNNIFETLQTEIGALANGTPIPVSNISQMTDHTKIYVNTTDGYWYYWNGSNWIQGGVYQSTGIGKNEIESYNIKNLTYEKVDDNIKTIEITDSMITDLINCTKEFSNNKFTIRRGNPSSNSQFRFRIPLEDTSKNLIIFLNTSNMRINPVIQYYSKDNVVKAEKAVFFNGKSYFYIKASDITGITTLVVFFSVAKNAFDYVLENNILVTFDNILEISNSSYINSNFENLSDILNSKRYYKGVTNQKENIILYKNFTPTNTNEVIISNNFKNIQLSSTKDGGLQSELYSIKDGILYVEMNVLYIEPSKRISFVLRAYDSNNSAVYHSVHVTSTGKHKFSFDLTYLNIYENMESFELILNTNNGEFNINDFNVYFNNLEGIEIYDDNLENVIIKTQNKITELNNSKLNKILESPNGNKFLISVDNNGQLHSIPFSANYTKGLFIGNSLLLGFVTHGMASYSVNDDYYHYVTEYLTDEDSNFTSSKISGTPWEAATNSTEINNYISSIAENLTSDIDLVIIQLGDNCNTSEKINYIPEKLTALVSAIRENCPNAIIHWVASWYNNSTKENLLINSCNINNVNYINIADLRSSNTMAKIGDTYIDSNGDIQTITSAGVASHPSSVGMLAIANRIIENL